MITFKRIFISALILLGIWIYGLTLFVKTIPTKVEVSESATDGIVILTGGSNRLGTGIKLLDKNKAKKLLITGVGKEADLTALLILSGKLPDNIANLVDRIELGYEAKNTKGNAAEAAQWVEDNNFKSILIVTANYHINRSMVEFKKHLPGITIVAYPVIPEHFSLDKWWEKGGVKKVLITEYNKFLFSKIIPFV